MKRKIVIGIATVAIMAIAIIGEGLDFCDPLSLKGEIQDEKLYVVFPLVNTASADDLTGETAYVKLDPVVIEKFEYKLSEEETAYVKLDPVAAVDAGEPLVVTGTSNWEEGYVIVVTCTGPMELSPQVVKIDNGAFEATFDTTGAVTGEYIVKADDGDGHVDEVEVFIRGAEVEAIEKAIEEVVEEVVEEISATPAPTPSEAVEEVVEEVVEEISATPAPTPSEAIEEVVEEVVEEISRTPAPTPSEAIEEVVEEVVEEISATPAPTPSDQELIDKALKGLPEGRILFNPPEEMKVGETELVEVRITQNLTEDLTKGLEGPGDPQIRETEVSTYMKVRLTGSGFNIVPEISEPQMIESDKYTHWEFHVTPLKSGIQTLKLFYYVIIHIQGADRQKEYEVGVWEVNIKVTPMGLLKRYWQFIAGTLIAIVALIISIIGIRKKQREKR